MGKTKKQKRRERLAQLLDEISDGDSLEARWLRAKNKRIDRRKKK